MTALLLGAKVSSSLDTSRTNGKVFDMIENQKLNLDLLDNLVASGNGWSLIGRMVPLAGEGAVVQPPTYAKSKDGKRDESPYLLHRRMINGESVRCVKLNSIQGEANAHEFALEEAIKNRDIKPYFPEVRLVLDQVGLDLSTAELPHRCSDARLRDSEINGKPYRESKLGRAILDSHDHDMTGLYTYDVRTFLHGVWDSHALGSESEFRHKMDRTLRLQRLLTAEITGINIEIVDRRAQLNDPLHFSADLPLKDGYGDDYYQNLKVEKEKGEVASAGLSSVPASNPGRGGVSMEYALYESTASIAVLRRYKFPIEGKHDIKRDHAARVVISALALLSQTIRVDRGFSIRSGCDLMWEDCPLFTFYGRGRKDILFEGSITISEAYSLYTEAYMRAKNLGLGWKEGKIYKLEPSEAFRKRIAKNLEWEKGFEKKNKKNKKSGDIVTNG